MYGPFHQLALKALTHYRCVVYVDHHQQSWGSFFVFSYNSQDCHETMLNLAASTFDHINAFLHHIVSGFNDPGITIFYI